MTTPAADRVAAAAAEGGVLASSAVRRLCDRLKDDKAAAQYNDWARNPNGRLVAAALRDLALNGPSNVDAESVAVQYGVTLGLNLAASILTDPSAVFPGLFGVDRPLMPNSADFAVNPYEALDEFGE